MNRNISVGLDIGTYSINTAVLEFLKKENTPKILALNSIPSSGLRKGRIADVKSAAKAIQASVKGAEKTAGLSLESAFVSIGGVNLYSCLSKGMVAISRPDGEITESDVKRVIAASETNLLKMANRRVIDTAPVVYKVDNEIIGRNPLGMKGSRLEVETLFVITAAQDLNNLIKSVELAGLKIDDVIPAPVAAAKVLLDRRQKEVGVLLFDVGAGTTGTAIFEEGMPVAVNMLPFGSESITNDIALILQISLDEAERLKHLFGTGEQELDRQTTKKLSDVIEARLNDVFELVGVSLRKINREKLLPGGVVLTGGGSNLANIVEFTKSNLKMPAEIGICLGLETKEKRFFDCKWSTALGLAMLGLDETPDLEFNLAKKAKNFLARWFNTFVP